MTNKLVIALLLAAVTLPGHSSEADIEAKPFQYPHDVMVYDLPTAPNGIDYRLYVRPPLRAPGEGHNAPSIYILDPISLFAPAAAMTAHYETFNYMPAAYFIGIGYQDEADGTARTHNRTRDYTPTSFSPPDETHFLAANPADYEGSGGADAFLDVVESLIVPFVEARFDVSGDDRVLIGNSMSGLAAVHTLLNRPGLFNRYAIVSPALWWDDWMLPRQDQYVMQQVGETSDTSLPIETRVYFAVGSAEERLRLVTDLYVLVDALRQRGDSNLKLHLDVLEDEIHEGVFPAAFMRGIVGVYAGEPERRPSATRISW